VQGHAFRAARATMTNPNMKITTNLHTGT
jgi:hypothetical protein